MIMNLKTCTKCNIPKELSEFYFRKDTNKYRKQNKHKRDLYLKKNKIKIRKRNRLYLVSYRKNNLNARITNNLSTRVRIAIKGQSKSKSTMVLLGCSIEFLKKYLQDQFKEGMSWDNHGLYGWHIDHIKPCCKFDLTKESEQKLCFHYTNLQPLLAKENLSKGGSFAN